jgi:hypothetical protein
MMAPLYLLCGLGKNIKQVTCNKLDGLSLDLATWSLGGVLYRELIRHNLIPKAVRYYTGEIVPEDDGDEDEEYDDEDEDDEVSHITPQVASQ